jgi:hypothetical protein
MIASIKRISHVGNLASYLLGKDDAKVLAVDTLLYKDGDPRELIEQEIEALRSLRPKVERVAAHLLVSLPPGKTLDEDTWRRIVGELREKMGFQQSPIFAVLHNDNGNQHVHVIAGAISYEGERVDDSFEGLRVVKAAAEVRKALGLEHEKLDPGFELEPREVAAERGTLKQLRSKVEATGTGELPEKLFVSPSGIRDSGGHSYLLKTTPPGSKQGPKHERTLGKRELRQELGRLMDEASDIRDFIGRATERGIQPSFNLSPTTGRVSGVKYRVGGRWYKGSTLAKDLAWGGLRRRFDPRLDDLPALLAANQAAGSGVTLVERRLAPFERARLGLKEGDGWLWIARPDGLQVADVKDQGIALVSSEKELAQIRKERTALGREVGKALAGMTPRTAEDLAKVEKVIRETAYADERFLPLLERYPSLRRRLPLWRKELLAGQRNDMAEYLCGGGLRAAATGGRGRQRSQEARQAAHGL